NRAIHLVFAILLASSAFQTLGRPARASLLPTIVPPHIFSNAVTWNSSVWQVASVLGPMIAGGIIALFSHHKFGTRVVYALDAACGLFYALAIFTLTPTTPQARTVASDVSIAQRLTAGIRFVWNTPIILATLTLDLFAVLFGGATYLF